MTLLAVESLLIPLMWITGHRANNSFMAFCLLFVVLCWISSDFYDWFSALITRISRSRVRIRRRFLVLVGIEVFLVVMHLQVSRLRSLWDLDWEGGIGTTYSGFLLAVATMLAYYCCRHSARMVPRIAWMLFSILLLSMTIDELSEFHHWLASLIWRITTGQGESILVEGLSFWIIVLSPLIVSIIVGIVWFVRNILHEESRLTACAALLCWIGSQTLEATIGSKLLPHTIEIASEEFLEMFGTTLFIVAFYHEYGVLQSLPRK